MTRIATNGAHQLYTSRIMDMQKRIQQEQVQVTTLLKSQTYTGISAETSRLINMENQVSALGQFKANNSVVDTKISVATTAINSIDTTINNFKKRLDTFKSGNTKDQLKVEEIQKFAYDSLVDIQAFFGAQVDGQYLFSGGRTDTDPMSLPAGSLEDFQKVFDGFKTLVPTSRAANLADVHLTKKETGNVVFDPTTGLIKSTTAAAFNGIPALSRIVVSNTTSNNQSVNVTSHAVTNASGSPLTEGMAASGTFISTGGTAATATNIVPVANSAGTPLTAGAAAASAFITRGAGAVDILNAATGVLNFTANTDGTLQVTPTTAGSLAALTAGTKFTIGGDSTYAGNYVVTSNVAGSVNFRTDTTVGGTETLAAAGVGLQYDTGAATGAGDGVPDASAAAAFGGGNIAFTRSGNTVTMKLPAGTTFPLPSDLASGKPIRITGTASHNGTYSLSSDPVKNADGTVDLKFKISPPLDVAFNADGSMNMTLGANTALNGLAIGTKFTIGNSGGSYDGSYVVTATANGVVSFTNDNDAAKPETVSTAAGFRLQFDTGASGGTGNGIPDSNAGITLGSGNATFTVSGNTMTLTLPSGTTYPLPADVDNGLPIGIVGTAYHNGSYKLNSAPVQNADGSVALTFDVNPDALRISQFVPQTGRTDVTLSYNDGAKSFTSANYTSLSFSPTGTGGETITAASATAFMVNGTAQPPVGATFRLSSTTGVNDGVYEVVSNDGQSIVVASKTLSTETAIDAKIDTESWYQGDQMQVQQRIDTNRKIDVSVYASDPAFEKAVRAMYLIAQGQFGTAGGLENNQERISAAAWLLTDSRESPAAGPAPFGSEERSDIKSVTAKLGVAAYTLKIVTGNHDSFRGFLDGRIAEDTQVDKSEAIVKLLNDSNALQASYQALGQIRNLTLLNFLK